MRVGIIGLGAIGGVIANAIADGVLRNATLAGALRANPSPESPIDCGSIEELLDRGCDLVVEAAGSQAVRDYGVTVVKSGAEFLILSASALADPVFETQLLSTGPGVIRVSSGAIGGLDLLRAMRMAGSLESVSIVSTTSLDAVAGELDPELVRFVDRSERPVIVASGTAREVASRFPKVTNVAATLALATLGFDSTKATLQVDRKGRQKRHVIEANGHQGHLRVDIANHLSDSNVRTSAVTPFAALRFIEDANSSFVVGC